MNIKKSLLSIVLASALALGSSVGSLEKNTNFPVKYSEETINETQEEPFSGFSSFGLLAFGIVCLVVYETLRRKRQKTKEQINERKLVSENGYDLCVICKSKTPYETTKNIDDRVGYIKGTGQLCSKCYGERKEKDYSVLESDSRFSG